jgi:hypothetical protein
VYFSKVSILLQERKKLTEAEKSYNPREQLVASGFLQMVKIKCPEVDGIVLRILKMLNASGVPFDKIIIQCVNRRSCSGCKLTIDNHQYFYFCNSLICVSNQALSISISIQSESLHA